MRVHTLIDVAAVALLADFLGMGLALLAGRRRDRSRQISADASLRHSNFSRRAPKRRTTLTT